MNKCLEPLDATSCSMGQANWMQPLAIWNLVNRIFIESMALSHSQEKLWLEIASLCVAQIAFTVTSLYKFYLILSYHP